jgi:hypothetical protein
VRTKEVDTAESEIGDTAEAEDVNAVEAQEVITDDVCPVMDVLELWMGLT